MLVKFHDNWLRIDLRNQRKSFTMVNVNQMLYDIYFCLKNDCSTLWMLAYDLWKIFFWFRVRHATCFSFALFLCLRPLDLKGCICHLIKWEMHPSCSKVTLSISPYWSRLSVTVCHIDWLPKSAQEQRCMEIWTHGKLWIGRQVGSFMPYIVSTILQWSYVLML